MIKVALIVAVAGSADGIQSASFAAAHEAFRFRPSVELMSPEAVPQLIEKRIAECGLDVACTSEQIAAIPADLGIVAGINLLTDPPAILVSLVGAKAKTAKERTASGAIGPVLARAIGELLDEAGHPLAGELVVVATPNDATIAIDRATATRAMLSPGVHHVEVSREGFLTVARDVTVAAGARAEVSIALEAEPAELPWLWIGAGAVVVTAVAIVAIAIAAKPGRLCVGGDQPQCN